jgi:hypothetical protein
VDQYGDSAPENSVPLYRITNVEDSTMIGPSGGFQRAKRIYFAVAGGPTSYVEVPLTEFKRETVNNLILQHVADLSEVLALQGPPVPPPG